MPSSETTDKGGKVQFNMNYGFYEYLGVGVHQVHHSQQWCS